MIEYFLQFVISVYMLNRLLEGFDGKLNSSKWAKITKCSQDTAGRDISTPYLAQVLARGLKKGQTCAFVKLSNYLKRKFY